MASLFVWRPTQHQRAAIFFILILLLLPFKYFFLCDEIVDLVVLERDLAREVLILRNELLPFDILITFIIEVNGLLFVHVDEKV